MFLSVQFSPYRKNQSYSTGLLRSIQTLNAGICTLVQPNMVRKLGGGVVWVLSGL